MTDELLYAISEKIEDCLSGYRAGSKIGYGYFLREFIPLYFDSEGLSELAQMTSSSISNFLEKYSKEKGHKPSTIRAHKFAVKAFLRSCDVELGQYDLRTKPWDGQTVRITEADFRLFLKVIDESEKEEIAKDLKLISCLAYYGGLTLNEILRLTNSSFSVRESMHIVHVTAVSSKSKDRFVTLPKTMESELVQVLSRGRNPLLSLKKNATEVETFAAKKLKLQRLIQSAAAETNKRRNTGYDLRLNLKAFRTHCIYDALLSGIERKDVMKNFGVSEYYISHLLHDSTYGESD